MNKIFGCTILCLLIINSWAMEQRWLKEFGDGPAKARKLHETLSPEKQLGLDFQLLSLFDPEHYETDTYAQVKELLDRGADPDGKDYRPLLQQAVRMQKADTLIPLLLAYGANPTLNLKNLYGYPVPPITEVHSFKALTSLVRAGADINARSCWRNALSVLCNVNDDGSLVAIVWALQHKADSNLKIGTARPTFWEPLPIYIALRSRNLSAVIALLQYGTRFNITFKNWGTPLKYAQKLSTDWASILNSQAQYELLKAVSKKHLNPRNLSETECKAKDISDESTQLIVEAAQKVDDARAEARLADIKYEHGNLTKYVLDRALGHSGTRKR